MIYDFGGDPRGFATNHEQTEITTFEARLQSPPIRDSRWAWLVGAFYSKEKGNTAVRQLRARLRGHAVVRRTSATTSTYYSGNPLAPTDRWFLGRYDTELDQIAVFGELSFDVTENFTITAGGRWFDYDRKFEQHQEQPGASAAAHAPRRQRRQTSEDGTVASST